MAESDCRKKTILHQGIEPSGVQYLRLSNMQFLQNVSTSAASAGVLTHGVIPGSSHTPALGISSPGIEARHDQLTNTGACRPVRCRRYTENERKPRAPCRGSETI